MSADLLRQLLALDLSTEQALAVMDIIENRDGDRKEKARARWHKWNDKRLPNVSKREPTLANVSSPTHASASPAPDLENKQTNKEERKQDTAPVAREFEESFWPAYPLKRGKADALKAFLAARKRASLEIIMAGVRRYAAERAGEDSKFTKHAQGWLSGDHWTDEPAPPRPARQAHAPPGRRMNPVEAYQSLHSEPFHEPSSASGTNGNVEFLRPDRPGLPAPSGNIRYRPREPDERSNH